VRYRRRQSPDPHETAEKVQALGRRFTAIQADLSRQDDIETIVDQAVAAMGRVDILVNNAGTIRRADALTFSEKDWDAVINLNLVGVLSFTGGRQAVHSQGDGGKIINIASCSRFRGDSRPLLYRLKSGVLGYPPDGQRMGWTESTSTPLRRVHGHQ
jgi:2-deoxy-D-gluconate 3-dehydrogenase